MTPSRCLLPCATLHAPHGLLWRSRGRNTAPSVLLLVQDLGMGLPAGRVNRAGQAGMRRRRRRRAADSPEASEDDEVRHCCGFFAWTGLSDLACCQLGVYLTLLLQGDHEPEPVARQPTKRDVSAGTSAAGGSRWQHLWHLCREGCLCLVPDKAEGLVSTHCQLSSIVPPSILHALL